MPFAGGKRRDSRSFGQLRTINPVVKAPTLVSDDGEVLTDSTLFLEYAEVLARPHTAHPSGSTGISA
jgi:glutathione S-transferase